MEGANRISCLAVFLRIFFQVYGSADALGVKLDVGMMSLVHAAMVSVGALEHARGFRALNDGNAGPVPDPGDDIRLEEEFELQQDDVL